MEEFGRLGSSVKTIARKYIDGGHRWRDKMEKRKANVCYVYIRRRIEMSAQMLDLLVLIRSMNDAPSRNGGVIKCLMQGTNEYASVPPPPYRSLACGSFKYAF